MDHLYSSLMDILSAVALFPLSTNITIIYIAILDFHDLLVLHIIIICQGWKKQTFEKVFYLSWHDIWALYGKTTRTEEIEKIIKLFAWASLINMIYFNLLPNLLSIHFCGEYWVCMYFAWSSLFEFGKKQVSAHSLLDPQHAQ